MSRFDKITRQNWGYWDGVSARRRGRYPVWAKTTVARQKHPFDKHYGDGFWAGWYGEPPLNGYATPQGWSVAETSVEG